jgi:hypothetical protein
MSSLPIVVGLVALAIIGYNYYTLASTRPFSTARVWLLPAIVAGFTLANVPSGLLASGAEVQATLLSVALGLATGLLQGFFISLDVDANGVVWQKGSTLAAVLLLASLPLRLGLRFVILGGASLNSASGSQDLIFSLLAMFLALLVSRSVTILARHPRVVGQLLA